jgi:DNA-binding MarR family transcriptional regulator
VGWGSLSAGSIGSERRSSLACSRKAGPPTPSRTHETLARRHPTSRSRPRARRVLRRLGMNVIFFGLKRAYHGVLRIGRIALARLGLTAARFDMLYAILEHGSGGMLQRTLRHTLGVSAPTVSRMLASLEELGFVRRTAAVNDRRQRVVELTDSGRACIERGERMLADSGHAQLAVDCALSPDRWYDTDHCFFLMDRLDSFLEGLRQVYGDFATLYYRWHPDD